MDMDEQAADHERRSREVADTTRRFLVGVNTVRVVERKEVTICSDSLRWSIGSTMIGTLES